MPHLTVEYTANLDRSLNVPELVDTLHAVAASIEAFPLAGIRTRAVRIEHFRFADGHPDNAWVHVVLRIAHGRTLAVKQAAGELGHPEGVDVVVDMVQGDSPLGEFVLRYMGRERHAVQMGQAALPAGKWGGPISTIGNFCITGHGVIQCRLSRLEPDHN